MLQNFYSFLLEVAAIGECRSLARIIFLCTSSLDYPSPRGRWLPVAQQLVQQGHEAHLVMLHPTYDRLTSRSFEHQGVQLHYVAQMHVYGYPGARRPFSSAELLAVSLRGASALAAKAVSLKPGIIHVAKPQPINGLASMLAQRSGARLFVDCDDYEAGANRFGGGWQQRVVQWWEDTLPQRARAVSVNTRFLFERYRLLGILEQRLLHVPNGISAAQFVRPSQATVEALRAALRLGEHPTLIYLGAMSTIAHGVGLLLEAFASTLRQLPEARLLMVGDGDDRPALQAQAYMLGIAPAVRWVGPVPAAATRAYLALADASVDPVYDAPAMAARSPLKIVESLALGVPVVTSPVGDRRAMLGYGGVLVAPGDVQALAEGIARILADSQRRRQAADAARVQAESYRWERLVQEWQRMYSR